MADITYTPLEETTALNADSLNSRFSDPTGSVREAVNALEPDAVAPGALNHHHFLSGLVMNSRQAVVGSSSASHTYTRAQTGANYLPFNTAGGAGSGTSLQFTGMHQTLSDSGGPSNVAGILVLADLHLFRVYDPTEPAADRYDIDAGISARIEYEVASVWYSIDRSQRWVSSQIATSRDTAWYMRGQQVKIPIRTLIVASDIFGGGEVTGIRATVNVRYNPANQSTATAAEFYQCDLAAIRLVSTRT